MFAAIGYTTASQHEWLLYYNVVQVTFRTLLNETLSVGDLEAMPLLVYFMGPGEWF